MLDEDRHGLVIRLPIVSCACVCLSACLPVCLSICLSVCPFYIESNMGYHIRKRMLSSLLAMSKINANECYNGHFMSCTDRNPCVTKGLLGYYGDRSDGTQNPDIGDNKSAQVWAILIHFVCFGNAMCNTEP